MVSWRAHSYDMETMGGSNEEHMLLCFNRAAHCARKGILHSYSDTSQWKSEPSLSWVELTISIRFSFPLFFFFSFFFSSPSPGPLIDFNSLRVHFAYCTYVTCFVRQIEEQWRAKLESSKRQQSDTKQTWKQRKLGRAGSPGCTLVPGLS